MQKLTFPWPKEENKRMKELQLSDCKPGRYLQDEAMCYGDSSFLQYSDWAPSLD